MTISHFDPLRSFWRLKESKREAPSPQRASASSGSGPQQIFMMAGQDQLALLIVYRDFGRDFAPVTKICK
jgi:hypothetical protein